MSTNPSFSVRSTSSLPQRLMMRMARLDGRARQVGQLLAGQRQRNEHAAALLAAELIGQLEKQPGEARLDAAAGQLGEPGRELDETERQAAEQPAHERGMPLEQVEERLARNQQAASSARARRPTPGTAAPRTPPPRRAVRRGRRSPG